MVGVEVGAAVGVEAEAVADVVVVVAAEEVDGGVSNYSAQL